MKLATSLPAALIITAASTFVIADDFTYKIGTGMGVRQFKSVNTSVIPGVESVSKLDVEHTTINVNFGAAHGRLFTLLEYETSLSDSGAYSDTPGFTPQRAPVDVGLEDYTFTLGVNVWRELSVSLGYRSGTSTITTYHTGLDVESGLPIAEVGGATFKQTGPFLGLGYSFAFEIGVLSLGYAYAPFTGEYKEAGSTIVNVFVDDTKGTVTTTARTDLYSEGDSQGHSIALSWQGYINETASYYFKVDYQDYDFETDMVMNMRSITTYNGNVVGDEESPINGTNRIEEKVNSVYFGVNWFF
ncbi:MAG: hypothetical protein HRU20_19985 [Pseudomonadales bacterium]|nr:hypothetical protein [Pseudomonadales bacterium]